MIGYSGWCFLCKFLQSPTWRKFILLGFTKNVNLHCMYPLYLMSSEYQYLRKDKPHGSVGGLYNFRDLIMEDGPV
ncbi:mannose-1-phosphate guanylyltransferase [Ranunculus cassubicifolius]